MIDSKKTEFYNMDDILKTVSFTWYKFRRAFFFTKGKIREEKAYVYVCLLMQDLYLKTKIPRVWK